MPKIYDMRGLWSEGREVSEIACVIGYDRKTVRGFRSWL